MVIPVTFDVYEGIEKKIKAMKRPFTVKETSSSKMIKNDYIGVVTSELLLGKAALGHLISSKCEILHRAKDIDLSIPPCVQWYAVSDYFVSSEMLIGSMRVSEFDLAHAYWKAAFRLGLLSEKTYLKYLAFKTKKLRLIALGMLAKKELVREFDETGKETKRKVNTSENGKAIFRRVAYEVASEMKRIAEENQSAFRWYWFDNCVLSDSVQKINTEYEYRVAPREMKYSFHRSRFIFDLLDEDEFIGKGKPSKRRFSFPESALLGSANMITVPF